jgi:hypothetical protein
MVDEEDIPANFPEENDDLLVKEPVCKCRLLLLYCLLIPTSIQLRRGPLSRIIKIENME